MNDLCMEFMKLNDNFVTGTPKELMMAFDIPSQTGIA